MFLICIFCIRGQFEIKNVLVFKCQLIKYQNIGEASEVFLELYREKCKIWNKIPLVICKWSFRKMSHQMIIRNF